MRCTRCGYLSFDVLETCRQCGADLVRNKGAAPAEPEAPIAPGHAKSPAELIDVSAEIGEIDLVKAKLTRFPDGHQEPERAIFTLDESIFQDIPGTPEVRTGAEPSRNVSSGARSHGQAGSTKLGSGVPESDAPLPAFTLFEASPPAKRGGSHDPAVDTAVPAFSLSGIDAPRASDEEPIIDSDAEVPDDLWVPEVAGFGRRTAALLIDQSLLAVVLGGFFLGAFVAFRLSGFDTDDFLAPAGLQAAALPFGLLGALVSLVYYTGFHGTTGRTPGKAVAGVELRAGDGGELSWFRVILRWLCATLGVASAGAGLAWALFEPRRRGWADLLSGTVIARRSQDGGGLDSR